MKRQDFKDEKKVDDKAEKFDKKRGKNKRTKPKFGSDKQAYAKNDMAWYSKDPTLIDAVARIPFGSPSGLGNLGFYQVNEIPDSSVDDTEASVMRIEILHGPGVAIDATAPVNVIANNQYAVVRHMNSRATSYDAPDLMMMYLAVGELYALHSQLERAYGVLNLYTGYNRFLPKTLFSAMGFDYDDWVSNRAQVLAYAHILEAQINVFNVPNAKTMPYYTKLYWAYHNIYADYPLPKAQMYVFTPSVYYVYSPIADSRGGQLKPKRFPVNANGHITFAGFKSVCEEVLAAILPDQDIGNMSGDVLKAFGEANMLRIAPLSPDYKVGLTYDDETLWKIHNMNFAGVTDTAEAIIRQNVETNLIKWDPRFIVPIDENDPYAPIFRDKCYLDLPMADPDVKAVVESTRLMTTDRVMKYNGDIGVDGAWVRRLSTSDMIIPCFASVYGAKVDATTQEVTYGRLYGVVYDNVSATAPETALGRAAVKLIAGLSQFRLHPCVAITDWERPEEPEDVETIKVFGWVWDTHNSTTVSMEQLRRIHDACLLSEFGVPLM